MREWLLFWTSVDYTNALKGLRRWKPDDQLPKPLQ
jgi:hypothetical protein